MLDRHRRAAVAIFVDVVAHARPTLTELELDELRVHLEQRLARCS